MALHGVGRLTAMTLVAEIGDITWFPTARKLCAWAGLTPAVRNLRPQGPPRSHHQTGLPVGALDPPGSHPDRQAQPHVRHHLRPARPPPGQADRHRGDRPSAAGPLLPTSSTSWRPPPPEKAKPPGALVTNRMRLQHGR
jgi:Transposase IS116/IS110/IS902 family